jgi:hypothetical protein
LLLFLFCSSSVSSLLDELQVKLKLHQSLTP